MKMNITIEVNSEYLPHFYAALNHELKAAKMILNDEIFCKTYPALAKGAREAVVNLTPILDKLLDEF